MKSSSQIKEFTQYTPVRKEFTSRTSYKQVVATAEKREVIFQDFVQFLVRQNDQMVLICSKLHEQNHLLFNDHIRDSFQLINECWDGQFAKKCRVQTSQIEDVIHSPEYRPENTKLEVIQEQAQQFEKLQEQLIVEIKVQNDRMEAALLRNEKYGSERDKLLNYFNPNYLKEPIGQMNTAEELFELSRANNSKLIAKLEKSKLRFLSVIEDFREVSMKNRSLFEKKFYKVCGIVIDSIVTTYPQLLKQLKNAKYQIKESFFEIDQISSNDEKGLGNRITSDDLFSICSCIQNMMVTVVEILQSCKTQRQKFHQKLVLLTKTEDSAPCRALHFVLDTLDKVDNRINQISGNMVRKIKMLEEEEARQNALLGRSSNNSTLQSSIRRTKVSSIESSLTLPSIINGIFEDMIDPLTKLVSWIQTSLPKERILLESLQGNIKTKKSQNPENSIHEQQMWMFDDWNSTQIIRVPICSRLKQELKKTRSTLQSQKKIEGREIVQSQKCELWESSGKFKKGTLTIYDNCVKFVSSQNNFTLTIPYQSIRNVKNKLQMFKIDLVLYTSKGKISFTNLSKALKSKQKIADILQSKGQNSGQAQNMQQTNKQVEQKQEQNPEEGKGASTWKPIELTPAEISGMQARRAKILSQIPDKTGYKDLGIYLFRDITIDQFYFQIYSDEPKQINGKRWESFNQFLISSNGKNSEMTEDKFAVQGPKFYARSGDTTFQNCPSFSERECRHTHALDGIPIPFMPKTAKFREQIKVYWVSNEEFVIVKDTYSSGMKLFESFYIRFIYFAKKKGNDVQMTNHLYMIWVKDSAFKGMLERKCHQNIGIEMPKMMKIVENRVKAVVAASKGQKIPVQQKTKSSSVIQQTSNAGSSSIKESIVKSQTNIDPAKSTEESGSNPKLVYLIGVLVIILVAIKFL